MQDVRGLHWEVGVLETLEFWVLDIFAVGVGWIVSLVSFFLGEI